MLFQEPDVVFGRLGRVQGNNKNQTTFQTHGELTPSAKQITNDGFQLRYSRERIQIPSSFLITPGEVGLI